MNRLQDWPTRLDQFIESRRNIVFSWGNQDCCLFAAAAVEAITGINPAGAIVGSYNTALGAARLANINGGLYQLITKIASAKGCEEIAPLFAGRGDVVQIPHDRDGWPCALGIVDMRGQIAATGASGLVFQSLDRGVRAWRI